MCHKPHLWTMNILSVCLCKFSIKRTVVDYNHAFPCMYTVSSYIHVCRCVLYYFFLSPMHGRIMLLDAGQVKEFAAPNELLSNKKSSFYSMAKDAGLVA